MDKKKVALGLIVTVLVGAPLYHIYNVTDIDKQDAQQQQTAYTYPFVYYPNSFFQGYRVGAGNGFKDFKYNNVDFYGWHSWTNSTKGVISPYTSSNSSIKGSSGGVITSGHVGSAGGYSGVHAGSIAG